MFLSPMDGVGFGAGGSGLTEFPNLTDLHWRHVAEAANMSLSGSLVNTWYDTGDENGLAGTGEADIVGSGDTRPTFGAATGPNGTGSVLFDNDVMSINNMSTGLAQPYHFFWIMKQVSYTTYERLASYKTSGSANGNIGHQYGSSPGIEGRFGNPSGVGNKISEATLGTWVLYEVFANNSTSSYDRVNNGTKSTGINSGSSGPFIRFVMCGDDNMSDLPSHFDVAEAVHCGGGSEVTGDDHAQLMQYFRDRYGLTIS